ncbi:MAG: DUF2061 domain-containing protein [bacterium]|nr:DUF2061 domain-containing protein [bacterium]
MTEAHTIEPADPIADSVQPKVARSRSLVKALTYRAIITVLNFVVVYFLTRRTDMAIGFTLINAVYTSIAYYFHERWWSAVEWGRGAPPKTQ